MAKGELASFLGRCTLFVRQVLQEGRRIVWPTRRDVIFSSAIVFVLSAIFAVFFFFIDQLVLRAVQWIVRIGGNG